MMLEKKRKIERDFDFHSVDLQWGSVHLSQENYDEDLMCLQVLDLGLLYDTSVRRAPSLSTTKIQE